LERHAELAFENDIMLHLRRQLFNTWKALPVGMENDEQQFCRNSNISPDMLYRITLMDRGALALWRNSSVYFKLKVSAAWLIPAI